MRTRNYATIVYPESSPNFLDYLSELKVPCLVSPLHDDDFNPNGEKKKAHYHVLFLYDSVKTQDQAYLDVSFIGGVGVEPIKSTRAYARYLCHLDNPEKTQYNITSVKCLFGVDYGALIECTSDKYVAIKEMISFINRCDIRSFSFLLEYCMEHNESWFRHLCTDSSFIIKEYMKSRDWTFNKFHEGE